MAFTRPAAVDRWRIEVEPNEGAVIFRWRAHIYGYRDGNVHVQDSLIGRTVEGARAQAEARICHLVGVAKAHLAQTQHFTFDARECGK